MSINYKGYTLETPLSYKVLKITAELQTAYNLHKEGYLDDRARNEWARSIGNTIYDTKHVHSGFVSGRALQHRYHAIVMQGKRVKDSPWTAEHFVPRQIAGHRLIDWALSFETFDTSYASKVHDELQQYRVAHYVLSQENNDLRPYQKKETYTSWEESYKLGNVDVYEWKVGTKIHELPKVYPHLVEGIDLY